jgi:hypothetical protein
MSSRRCGQRAKQSQALPFGEGSDLIVPATAKRRTGSGELAAPVVDPSAPADGRKSHCPAGHPYDEANTYVNPRGGRSCRICQRESRRRWRARTSRSLTPEQRVLRSRMGACRLHATHDPKETTKKARAAFATRFEREVDPNLVLDPAERARRAEAARRAYFTELALRSSRARRRAS